MIVCLCCEVAQAERYIRVAAPDNPPLSTRDAEGRPQGLAIEVLEAIAKDAGWHIEYVWGSLAEGMTRVQAEEVDLLVSIGHSPERAARMAFSEQTLLSNWGVVYGASDTTIDSFLDLRDRRVALMRNSLHSDAFLAMATQFGIRVETLLVDDYPAVFSAITSGDADAGVVNRLFSIANEAAHAVEFTGIVFSPVTVHYAAPHSRQDIIDIIDRDLAAMKLDTQSVYHRALRRWVEGVRAHHTQAWLGTAFFVTVGVLLVALLVAGLLRHQVNLRTRQLQQRERNLRESEGRYRALFEYSTVALWEEDFSVVKRLLDGLRNEGVTDLPAFCRDNPDFVKRCIDSVIVLDVNQAALALYKARDKDMLHRGLAPVMNEQALRIFREEMLALHAGRPHFEASAEQRTMTGETLQTHIRVTIAPGYEQSWSRVYVAVVDLTAIQQADAANTRLLAILNATPDFVAMADVSGRVTYLNEAGQQQFRKAGGNLGYIPDYHPTATAERILRQALPAAERDGVWAGETEWKTPEGRIVPVSQVILAHRNPAGETTHYSTVARDISHLRVLEQERSRAALEWMQAMDSFEDAVYLIDLDDTLIRANQAFYDFTGLKHADAIGKPITKLMHPYGEKEPCPVCRARAERRNAYVIVEPGPGNRFNRPVEVAVRVIRDEHDQPQRILMTIHDLTRTRQIESELRRYRAQLEELVSERTAEYERVNRELEAFAYSVSHDLRAPLRGINGFASALVEDCGEQLDDTGHDYLRRIRLATGRMAELIDDMLLLSRLSRHEMNLQALSLSEMAEVIVMELRADSPQRQTPVHVQPSIQVIADKNMLRGVLRNLLDNAWKFTARKPDAEIFVTAAHVGQEVIVQVRDTGVGFDMTYANKLFGAFQRLHGQHEYEGTGIGLATVQRIIHRHGGRVWAEGRAGEGASFFFSLPVRPAGVVEATSSAANDDKASSAG